MGNNNDEHNNNYNNNYARSPATTTATTTNARSNGCQYYAAAAELSAEPAATSCSRPVDSVFDCCPCHCSSSFFVLAAATARCSYSAAFAFDTKVGVHASAPATAATAAASSTAATIPAASAASFGSSSTSSTALSNK